MEHNKFEKLLMKTGATVAKLFNYAAPKLETKLDKIDKWVDQQSKKESK